MANHHTHVAVGMLAGAICAEVIGLSEPARALASGIAGGAALLPDVDTPTSAVAHSVGRIGSVLLAPVRLAAVKHRGVTHTALLGAVLSGAILLASSTRTSLIVPVIAGLMAALAARSVLTFGSGQTLHPLLSRRHRRWITLVVAVFAAVASTRVSLVHSRTLIAWAFAAGYASHLLADAIMNGVPLFWPIRPLSKRVVLGRIKTGSFADHLLGVVALVGAAVVIGSTHLG